jgi:hypothetical protein
VVTLKATSKAFLQENGSGIRKKIRGPTTEHHNTTPPPRSTTAVDIMRLGFDSGVIFVQLLAGRGDVEWSMGFMQTIILAYAASRA